jgi:hypothetical protein
MNTQTTDTQTDRCATPSCDNRARWYSIPEANRYGNDAPRRCATCCDAIAELANGGDPALTQTARLALTQALTDLGFTPVTTPLTITLGEFTVQADPDLAYDDAPLTHDPCGDIVCTIEQGDSLDVLARTAIDHAASCPLTGAKDYGDHIGFPPPVERTHRS